MTTNQVSETREEILSNALTARTQEVMNYQINIDNYALALQHIDSLPPDEQVELEEFTKQLRTLLASEKLEQKKAKIMLSVIEKQVE